MPTCTDALEEWRGQRRRPDGSYRNRGGKKQKKKRDRIADGVERANVWWGHKDDDDDGGDVPGATESFLQQSW